MGNVFTITEGLEILEPLKTDGYSTVYKGRRTGEFFSSVKLLPKPVVFKGSGDNPLKYTGDELSKLKKLSEDPHPNVGRIIDAGLSSAANLPFIEMELVEGPDLEKLMQSPNPAIFSIKEIIKVTEDISRALDHCHRMEIKHCDIRCSNIKLNSATGNYILEDFGFASMPEEHRHTSLQSEHEREFMAPEQDNGQMLYQTDVYRFGVVLFKLITGKLPSQTGQEQPLAELISLRTANMPSSWSGDTKEREKIIPQWLVNLTYKCLEKDPFNRFDNGTQLYEFVAAKNRWNDIQVPSAFEDIDELRVENKKLLEEKEELQKALEKQEFSDKIMYRQWKELNEIAKDRERELDQLRQKVRRPVLSMPTVAGLIVAASLLGAFSVYILRDDKTNDQIPVRETATTSTLDTVSEKEKGKIGEQPKIPIANKEANTETPKVQQSRIVQEEPPAVDKTSEGPKVQKADSLASPRRPERRLAQNTSLGQFKVKSKAYFHDLPDANTRRNAFIVHWNNAVLEGLDEKNGFVYIVFTNHLGQTSVGWLNKKDLTRLDNSE